MNYDEAAKIMISNNGESGIDSRVKRLDNTPTLWNFNISDEWDIRVKITYDVDHNQYFVLYDSENVVKDYIQFFDIYYCVYYKNKFKYAIANANFGQKYHLSNLGVDTKVIDTITETYDYLITDGNMKINTNSPTSFLRIDVNGIYTQKITSYTGYEHIISGESISQRSFGHSCSTFNGYTNLVIDGNVNDFYGTVIDLYNVCRHIS